MWDWTKFSARCMGNFLEKKIIKDLKFMDSLSASGHSFFIKSIQFTCMHDFVILKTAVCFRQLGFRILLCSHYFHWKVECSSNSVKFSIFDFDFPYIYVYTLLELYIYSLDRILIKHALNVILLMKLFKLKIRKRRIGILGCISHNFPATLNIFSIHERTKIQCSLKKLQYSVWYFLMKRF